MEDPIVPAAAAALPAAQVRRFAWLHKPSIKTLLLASGALFIVVVLVNVALAFPFLKFVFLTHGSHVETVENGVPTWYALSFGTAKKVDGAPGFKKAPVTVLEAVAYGEEGAHVVLARVPGVEGIAIGILHTNNTFENVLSDGTNKANLAVRPDGIALYAAMIGGESRLMHLNLANPSVEPRDKGAGNSPRLFADGFFVAITSAGLVRIDPNQPDTQPILPLSVREGMTAALSPDASQFVASTPSGKTMLYRVVRTSPAEVQVAGMRTGIFYSPVVTFLGNGYLLEQTSMTSASLYRENKGSIENIGSLSFTK